MSRPILATRAHSDFITYPFHCVTESEINTNELPSALSTGAQSPSYQRHIHFNNRVEQCIAVDKADDEDCEYDMDGFESDSSDDGLVMMAPSKGSKRSTPRGSFSEPQTIAMLPSTTLKPIDDSDLLGEPMKSVSIGSGLVSFFSASLGGQAPGATSEQAPIETPCPPIIQTNFLVDDDDDDDIDDYQWQPTGAFANRRDSVAIARPKFGLSPDGQERSDDTDSKQNLHDSDSEEGEASTGLFGRAVDAVNTARDIAHVLWNVGWRK